MQRLNINGVEYVREDSLDALVLERATDKAFELAIELFKESTMHFETMLAKRRSNHEWQTEKHIESKSEQVNYMKALVEELRKHSVPASALLGNRCKFIAQDYNNRVVYIWVPRALHYMIENRKDVINKAIAVVFESDMKVHPITSREPLNDAEINSLVAELFGNMHLYTKPHRATMIAYRHIQKDLASGVITSWTYKDLCHYAGITNSAAYHAFRKMMELNLANMDNLIVRGSHEEDNNDAA